MTIKLFCILITLGLTYIGTLLLRRSGLIPGDSILQRLIRIVLSLGLLIFSYVMIFSAHILYINAVFHFRGAKHAADKENGVQVSAPMPTPAPSDSLLNACMRAEVGCVADLTSNTPCIFSAQGLDSSPLNEELNQYVRQCPAYRWKKIHGVYLIEPMNAVDDALLAPVGPVKEILRPEDLMVKFVVATHLRALPPNMGLGGADGARITPRKASSFVIASSTFKNGLITAAGQSRHTFWAVERLPGDLFTWHVKGY